MEKIEPNNTLYVNNLHERIGLEGLVDIIKLYLN
jgi:hypothetical protein